MREKFQIIYKNRAFNFELDKDGFVWLMVEKNGIVSGSNQGQVNPARNINEAREIAEIMLYAMGY